MTCKGFTAAAADFAMNLTYDQIPESVVNFSKSAILDLVGVTLAGTRSDEGQIMKNYAVELNENSKAGLVGCGVKTSVGLAALVNGIFSHALDYDDCNDSIHGHPSVALVPVILSLGQLYGISGKKALEAYVAGFEIEAALGQATGDSSYEKGFHTTATLGVFGATIVAGKIIGLNTLQLRNALGIAASQAGGLKQNFGTMTKPLHAGLACRNGILAARLAATGFTGDVNILEAQQGYANAYCKQGDYDFVGLAENLGKRWDILEGGIIFKKYPCCAETHRGIEAALQIAVENNLDPADIGAVECLVQERVPLVCIYSSPQSSLEGKFSHEYCVARALFNRCVQLKHFEDSQVMDQDIQDFMRKISMKVDPKQTGRGKVQDEYTVVNITMKSGKVLSASVKEPKGTKNNPFTQDECIEKFLDCAYGVLTTEAAQNALKMISNLEKLENISFLVDQLTFGIAE